MNGARGRSNNYLLDGTDMNDGYRNDPAINQAGVFGTPATILPIDAVAEVNVLSNFEPEYGRNAGARRQHCHQERRQHHPRHRRRILPQRRARCAQLFQSGSGSPARRRPSTTTSTALRWAARSSRTGRSSYVDYEGQREPVGVVTLAIRPHRHRRRWIAQPQRCHQPVGDSGSSARNPWPAPNLSRTPQARGRFQRLVPPPSYRRLTTISPASSPRSTTDSTPTIPSLAAISSATASSRSRWLSPPAAASCRVLTPSRRPACNWSRCPMCTRSARTRSMNCATAGTGLPKGSSPRTRVSTPVRSALCDASTVLRNAADGLNPTRACLIIFVSGVAQLGATSSVPRHRIDSNNQVLDNFSWKINKHDVKFGFDFHRTTVQQYFDKNFRGRLSFSGCGLLPESSNSWQRQYGAPGLPRRRCR